MFKQPLWDHLMYDMKIIVFPQQIEMRGDVQDCTISPLAKVSLVYKHSG